MAFGVAVNNRFDLFIDEEEDPTELLQKQLQNHQQAEKSRADKDKPKRVNTKEDHKTAGGVASKTQQQQSSTVRPQQVTARRLPTYVPAKKPPPSAVVSQQPAAVLQQQATTDLEAGQQHAQGLRQNNAFRDRGDQSDTRGSDFRGPGGTRRGRGQNRGGLGSVAGSEGSGFDRFGKREFERRSGSDKTGLKPVEKRSGAGAHNWGTITDTIDSQLKVSDDLAEPIEARDPVSGNVEMITDDTLAGEDAVPAEEEKQMTLDEWKAMQEQERQRTKVNFNIRKPGEGCSTDPKWKKMQVLKKKETNAENTTGMAEDDQFEDAEKDSSMKPKNIVPIAINFGDIDRHGGDSSGRGRRGGRGGRGAGPGRGGGPQQQQRGGGRAPAGGEQAPNVDSEQDFPSLA